ncbi:hypothetical protein [Nitrobacter sp.]|uniref:hypothetical protein n=1 Tax=Nitrobacter sp. TaxID=29420 RepID=UPI00399D5FEA
MPQVRWGDVSVSGMRPIGRAAFGVVTILLLLLSLGGCSTSIADLPFGGSSDAPERAADVPDYPAVHDIPAPREQAAMDPAEQARVEKELIAARQHQSQAAQASEAR